MATNNINFKVKNGVDANGVVSASSGFSAVGPTAPILLNGSPGAEGYVLTSTGSGNTPIWSAAAGGGSSVIVSDTKPTGALSGNLWFDSANTRFMIYYDNYWVEAAAPAAAVGQLDGGFPNSNYAGISPIDAGGVV